jgi:uncharacterized protein (TIGR03435 family)
MRRFLPLALMLGCCAAAQEFEVASIKPAAPQDVGKMRIMMRGGPGTEDPGQITYSNVPLRNLVMNAYGMKNFQISGPAWLDTGHFDVLAKVPKGATKEDLKVMLQKLLAERFQLQAHREKKELPIYALVVAKNGPKLKESAEDAPAPPGGPQMADGPAPPARGRGSFGGGRGGGMMMMINNGRLQLTANRQPVSGIADMLSNQLGRPVVDQTGLTGKYDFTVEFTPEEGQMMRGPMGGMAPPPPGAGPAPGDAAPDGPAAANLFTALQEQLGLKLEPKKGSVDFLVIDHIEKTPTEN